MHFLRQSCTCVVIILSVYSQKNNIQLVSCSLDVLVEIVEHSNTQIMPSSHVLQAFVLSKCLSLLGYQDRTLQLWDEILIHI